MTQSNPTSKHAPEPEAILLKISTVAKLLSVSRSEAYEIAHQHLRPIRLGDKALRVSRDILLAWIAAQVAE